MNVLKYVYGLVVYLKDNLVQEVVKLLQYHAKDLTVLMNQVSQKFDLGLSVP